jgi:hypothetical protein
MSMVRGPFLQRPSSYGCFSHMDGLLMRWIMVLCGALPFFGSYVEAHTHLSSFYASFDEVVPLLDELVDDLAFGYMAWI